MTLHSDEAFEFLVIELASYPEAKDHRGYRAGQYGGDLWIPDLAWKYWSPRLDRSVRRYDSSSDLEQNHLILWYDAAWKLCRIGVLRPGEFASAGMGMARAFGDVYTITGFGRKWLEQAAHRPVIDPSRLAELLDGFGSKFGDGYRQRATEAVRTYRTNNYLATCVMAGAAAESILLAVAISKFNDEAKVLREYRTASGRGRITKSIIGNVSAGIASQFEDRLQGMHYWRDDAAHGVMTTISEIEAHTSLTQLLRLAQFSTDHWNQLTG